MKICLMCLRTLPLSKFDKSPYLDGYDCACKQCNKAFKNSQRRLKYNQRKLSK